MAILFNMGCSRLISDLKLYMIRALQHMLQSFFCILRPIFASYRAMCGHMKYPDYKNNGKIKWNFTKFVIGRDGEIVGGFEPTADSSLVRDLVLKTL